MPASERGITPIWPPPGVSEEADPVIYIWFQVEFFTIFLMEPTGQVSVTLSAVVLSLFPAFILLN